MEKVTGIGGLFFRAENPAKLTAWYRDTLGIDSPADLVWRQEAGPTVLAPFAKDSDYFPADRRWMINFRVANLDAMVAQLRRAGVVVDIAEDSDSEIGRFARLTDPEGNPIELWQPADR